MTEQHVIYLVVIYFAIIGLKTVLSKMWVGYVRSTNGRFKDKVRKDLTRKLRHTCEEWGLEVEIKLKDDE